MREITRKATVRVVWGTAIVGVVLGLVVAGHQVPEFLTVAFGGLLVTMGLSPMKGDQ